MSESQESSILVAIVGRPNVGKSTLFNRIIGRRRMVVSPTRGTTRDRVYGRTVWRGRQLTFLDMAGFEAEAKTSLEESIQRHVRRGIKEADIILFICDAIDGLVPLDQMIVDELRKTEKPVILAVNKLDGRINVPADFHAFGFTDVLPISGLHGRGVGDLLDRIVTVGWADAKEAQVPSAEAGDTGEPLAAIAIVGRQNVGKSSLFNTLVREERVVVSDIPGTTRDSVDSRIRLRGRDILLIDTAGLRHRRKVRTPVDMFSMSRTVEAVGRCDVALLLLDVTVGVTRDDQRIAQAVIEAGRGIVIAWNKWDLVKGLSPKMLPAMIAKFLPFAAFAPVVATSAKTGFQVAQSLNRALEVGDQLKRGLEGDALLTLLREAWKAHPPPRWRGRPIHLRKAVWIPGPPAGIELTTSPVGRLPAPYLHYLQKRLHAHPSLAGIPIRVSVKSVEREDGNRKAATERKAPRIHSPWGGTIPWNK